MNNGKYLNKVLQLGAKHALYSEDGKWYENLKKFPGILFDNKGYIILKDENDYIVNLDLQIGKKLNIPKGIEKLNGYDVLENMLCVCPNCHTLLDYKAIVLDKKSFKIIEHTISDKNIEYHNSLVIK